MNVINKINKMGIIPKENRTYIDFENNVKSHHIYENCFYKNSSIKLPKRQKVMTPTSTPHVNR